MGNKLNLKFKAKNEKKKNIILFLIFLLAFFLRVYKINSIPGFLNRDEASIGYNAYSILKTAKDEHNKILPLFFESFGDWKMPVYIYLTVPFVWLFGLEIYSVRLLSAIAGTLTFLVVYFLTKEISIINPTYIIGLGNDSFNFLNNHFGNKFNVKKVIHPAAHPQNGKNAFEIASQQLCEIINQ